MIIQDTIKQDIIEINIESDILYLQQYHIH